MPSAAPGGCDSCEQRAFEQGLPQWHVSQPYINLWIQDEPLGYEPATGPRVGLLLSYRQRDSLALASSGSPSYDPTAFGFGISWNSAWSSHIEADGGSPYPGVLLMAGGGQLAIENATISGGLREYWDNSRILAVTSSGTLVAYHRFYPDGRKDVYGQKMTNALGKLKFYLSEKHDNAGQKITFVYTVTSGGAIRLTKLRDNDGRETTISYVSSNAFSTNLISQVTDPFGRSAQFSYDNEGKLTGIVDVAGLSSTFAYDESLYNTSSHCWITSMTTPYGTTTFSHTDPTQTEHLTTGNSVGRAIIVTDPIGGKEMFIYRADSAYLDNTNAVPFMASSYSSGQVPVTTPHANTFANVNLNRRNSFHWGKKQFSNLSTNFTLTGNLYALSVNDYLKARMTHWHYYPNEGFVESTPSLEREPSPDGVTPGQVTWYDYAGKPGGDVEHIGSQRLPLFVAQVLPNSQTRYTRYERNAVGKVTEEISTYSNGGSVSTRTRDFVYDSNLVDLLMSYNASGDRVLSNQYNAFGQVTASFNAKDELTQFRYDDKQRLTNIVHPNGLNTIFKYYTNSGTNLHNLGYLREMTNAGFNGRSFGYTNGLVAIQTNELNLVVTNTWDALQRLTGTRFPDGSSISNVFNKLDLAGTKDQLDNWSYFGYNAVRQQTKMTNALGNVTTYAYCACGSLESVTDALGNVTSYSYDNAGRMTNIVYPGSTSVAYFYDLMGRQIKRVDGLETLTNYYNNQGLFIGSSNGWGQMSLLAYDIEDRVSSQTDANAVAVTQTYDKLDRLLTRTYPDGGLEKLYYAANSAGPTIYTNQLGNTTTYAYDALQRKTNEVQTGYSTTGFAYDAAGNLVGLADGNGHATSWVYDSFGRMRTKKDASNNVMLAYVYFKTGWLSNRVDALNRETKYTYDNVGNLRTVDYVGSGATPDLTYAYDAVGQLTNMVDRVGTTGYSYTGFGALHSEEGPWSSDLLTNAYNNTRLRSDFSLAQPSGSAWTNRFIYDAAKRLITLTASSAGTFGYSYHASKLRQPATLTLPVGVNVSYAYDDLARMTSTSLGSGRNRHQYGYDLGGRRTNVIHTVGSVSTNSVSYGYDTVDQLISASGFEVDGTARLQEKLSYKYDPAGNLIIRTNNALIQSFTTNKINQVTGMSRSGTLTVAGRASSLSTAVTLDGSASGVNLYADKMFAKQSVTIGGGSLTYTAVASDALNRKATNAVTVTLPSSVTYTYDANGNLKGDGVRTFDYDEENQLTNVQVSATWKVEFVYDGRLRKRIQKDYTWSGSSWTLGTETRYIYDGMRVIQERNGSNVPTVTYTRGLDLSGTLQGAGGIAGLLARTAGTNSLTANNYYHCDANGNVTALMASNGRIVARYSYDPFGNLLGMSGHLAEANKYRFSSKEIHDKSGLYCYGYRFYDPNLQRWLNRDPLGEAGGLNLYSSSGNNTISFIDIYGLKLVIDPDASADFKNRMQECICILASTGRGKELVDLAESLPQDVVIREAPDTDAPYDDGAINLDPTDPAGIGPETRKDFEDFTRKNPRIPNQRPPSTPQGCAVVLAHELGHNLYGENNEFTIIKRDENPVRNELGIPSRTAYRDRMVPGFPTRRQLRNRVGLH